MSTLLDFFPKQLIQTYNQGVRETFQVEQNIKVKETSFENLHCDDNSGGAIYSAVRISITLSRFVTCSSKYSGGAIFVDEKDSEFSCSKCSAIQCHTFDAVRGGMNQKGQFFVSKVTNNERINAAKELSISQCYKSYSDSCQRPMVFYNGNIFIQNVNLSDCKNGWCSAFELTGGEQIEIEESNLKYIQVLNCQSKEIICEFNNILGSINYLTIVNCETTLRQHETQFRYISLSNSNLQFNHIVIDLCQTSYLPYQLFYCNNQDEDGYRIKDYLIQDQFQFNDNKNERLLMREGQVSTSSDTSSETSSDTSSETSSSSSTTSSNTSSETTSSSSITSSETSSETTSSSSTTSSDISSETTSSSSTTSSETSSETTSSSSTTSSETSSETSGVTSSETTSSETSSETTSSSSTTSSDSSSETTSSSSSTETEVQPPKPGPGPYPDQNISSETGIQPPDVEPTEKPSATPFDPEAQKGLKGPALYGTIGGVLGAIIIIIIVIAVILLIKNSGGPKNDVTSSGSLAIYEDVNFNDNQQFDEINVNANEHFEGNEITFK
ncbi:hypothetical protein TVAG_039040 [Trichomonas vaginalis G3]|uniref:Uncharacterized protein n=1 Tax=Trichomonas vaginalis (strain ATCC PRA-98 / G3) TaxID=412133 RepID=A2E5L5_TRIV3|nr:di-glucose binding protein (with leucine-rich repeat domain) family [Trichomonas vaginalis G3]EAY12056.1 hypothetical protein TVAG_039040 [Trichomonas vaginalis G3]KAI5553260.1 di-glucose binding protein (with leucine-rich repeat domain) family [Trichomonas vaginalis G3]|eukprot:XP_001324279.1 hypothetical protein [Trichomonas vaginalis G3]